MSLPGVYNIFNERWCKQTIWLYSDPHFGDKDLATGVANRPSDAEQIARINACVGKKDTLICLGDVGDIECVRQLKGYKILVIGNHDAGRTNYERKIITEKYDINAYSLDDVKKIAKYKHYGWKITISEGYDLTHAPFHYWELKADNGLFDEVYEGPLMIGEKLILSHEPLHTPWAFNIHGHDHTGQSRKGHLNVCSDVINYTPINFNQFLKTGPLARIDSIHRSTIDGATERKKKRNKR